MSIVADKVQEVSHKVQDVAPIAHQVTDKVQDAAHQVQEVADKVHHVTQQANVMIVGAEKIMDALPSSISKSEVGVTIQQTLDGIQNVLKEADQFADQMEQMAAEADRAAEQAQEYIAKAEEAAKQAEQMADQADQVLSGCGFLSLCGCEAPPSKPNARKAPNAPKASAIQLARV